MKQPCNDILKESKVRGCELHLDLWYPRIEENIKSVVLGLVDVRAADSIRISYDFERDGWKIEQAQVFEWEAPDVVCDPKWKEVAFVQAWGSDVSGGPK